MHVDSFSDVPNGCAKILTGGTQEVSQKVVPDEKPLYRRQFGVQLAWGVDLLLRLFLDLVALLQFSIT
jgi:hypothetical protein